MGGGGVLLVTGSAAYYSVRGERPFNIGAVGDDLALLGIELLNPAGSEGERVDLLELTNGFDAALTDIDVTVESVGPPDNLDIVDIETPDSLPSNQQPDNSGFVTGEIQNCTGQPPVPVELYIEVSGGGNSVAGTRVVQVTCEVVTVDFYDCHEILDVPRSNCEYQESGHTTIGSDRNGDVCVTGDDEKATISIQNHVDIDGFLRAVDASDIIFEMGNHSMIDGAVNLHDASGSIDATTKNHSYVSGDFCASANLDVDVDIVSSGITDREPRVGRHLKVDAGADATVTLHNHTTIEDSAAISAGHKGILDIKNHAIIEGPLNVDSGQNANVTIGNHAEIHGDVTITADGNATVTVENHALIDGDLSVDAGGDAHVDVGHQAEITGDENY